MHRLLLGSIRVWDLEQSDAATEPGIIYLPEQGEPGKWAYELPPDDSDTPEGHYLFSAEVTDQVGLSSPECTALSGPDACWMGVLVVDRARPTITEASLDLEGDEGTSVKARRASLSGDHHRHGRQPR